MFAGFDPSKLDPRLVQELSELMRSLPHDKLMQMQSIMHNSMAGFDISKEVQAFETSLSPDFRAKLAKMMMDAGPLPADAFGASPGSSVAPKIQSPSPPPVNDIDGARLTLLYAVRDGALSPKDALKALFP